MSERLIRPNTPHYELRSEYDVAHGARLHGLALEGFEDVMTHRDGLVTCYADKEMTRRQLSLFYVDDGRIDEDEIVYSNFEIATLQREPIIVEALVTVDEYRTGPRIKLAQLSLKEYVGNADSPLLEEYHLEVFKGGGTSALLTTKSLEDDRNYEERLMTQYDYTKLLYRIEETAENMQILSKITHP
jgi:hypothetical protein